jgi:7-carboxy-7-deazaguanine synthase
LFCIIHRTKYASLHEVFSSIQGEGPWTGERHIFVRFLGCDIHCRYCDTSAAKQGMPDDPGSKFCRVQKSAESNEYDQIENPISSHALTEFCTRLVIPGPSHSTLSLTGGEPLLYRDFLMEWLGHARRHFRVYLETNGVHADAMLELRDLVDVISMDFKLPSATGLRPFWEEHKQFLAAARGKMLFVKVVVTKDASLDDILTSAQIIAGFDPAIPLVIQPGGGEFAPSSSLLLDFQNAALGITPDVRVIPQAHKILKVP